MIYGCDNNWTWPFSPAATRKQPPINIKSCWTWQHNKCPSNGNWAVTHRKPGGWSMKLLSNLMILPNYLRATRQHLSKRKLPIQMQLAKLPKISQAPYAQAPLLYNTIPLQCLQLQTLQLANQILNLQKRQMTNMFIKWI